MLDNLNAGKGTAGKLLNDEEIYKQLNLISQKVNTAIDKINSGQGTIGPAGGESAALRLAERRHARDDRALLKDVRANPKKFLSIKLRSVLGSVRPLRLIVNADDFGFTRDVNEGIVEAHRNGILTATTLMANGDAFEHAVALRARNSVARCRMSSGAGAGTERARSGARAARDVAELVRALLRRNCRSMKSCWRRCARSSTAGIRPTHIDTHKHTHLLPPVLDAVARIAHEFRIPWVRRPFDFGIDRARIIAKRALSRADARRQAILRPGPERSQNHRPLRRLSGHRNLWTPRSLAGNTWNALPPAPHRNLMCHPGIVGPDLRVAATRLKDSRGIELSALISPEVKI